MADFYDSTKPETIKLWSRKTWYDWRQSDAIFDPKNSFVGSDPDTFPFVEIDDFESGPGDEITIPLLHGIGGRGTVGDEELEGKETVQGSDTYKMKVDVLRHAVKCRGKFMNDQRVPWDTMNEGSKALREWFKSRRAVCVVNHLCGNSRQTDLAYTGLNTVAEPDADHIYRINQGLGVSNDQTVGGDNTALFDIDILDELVTLAEASTPVIKPWVYKGNPYYGMFLHPFVVSDMRKKSTTWYSEMRDALKGGMFEGNPIFTRALGMHRNVLLFSEPRITQGKNSATSAAVANTRRNVFFGAGAVALGYGTLTKSSDSERIDWKKATWDFGAKMAVAGTMVCGYKGIRFKNIKNTDADYGKIVTVAYSADRKQYAYPTGDHTYVATYDYDQPQS